MEQLIPIVHREATFSEVIILQLVNYLKIAKVDIIGTDYSLFL